MGREKPRKRSARGQPSWLQLYHWIIQSPAFAALAGSEVKLLIDLGAEFNGSNNGNLTIEAFRARWNSNMTIQKARDGLVKKGFLIRTRVGGLGLGPDLYAISWWPINECGGRHQFPTETRASHEWAKKKRPFHKLELVVPETGNDDNPNTSKNGHSIPFSGTRNAKGQFQKLETLITSIAIGIDHTNATTEAVSTLKPSLTLEPSRHGSCTAEEYRRAKDGE